MKIIARSTFGADVHDVDMRNLCDEDAAQLSRAVYEYKLLALHDVDLSDAEYVAMGRRFGTPQRYFQKHYHHPEFPEIFVNNNVPMDGQRVGVAGTGRMWHSDYQFFPEPLGLTFVLPRIVPPDGGRGTLFVDMVEAGERLPGHLRAALKDAVCFHDAVLYYKVQPFDIDKGLGELMEEFRCEAPGAPHPAFIKHPVLDREALYISSGFTTRVEGMSHEDSRQVLAETFAWMQAECEPTTEKWVDGKLLFWDNRQLIHRSSGTLNGGPSRSYRCGIYDGKPFYPGLPITGENQP